MYITNQRSVRWKSSERTQRNSYRILIPCPFNIINRYIHTYTAVDTCIVQHDLPKGIHPLLEEKVHSSMYLYCTSFDWYCHNKPLYNLKQLEHDFSVWQRAARFCTFPLRTVRVISPGDKTSCLRRPNTESHTCVGRWYSDTSRCHLF